MLPRLLGYARRIVNGGLLSCLLKRGHVENAVELQVTGLFNAERVQQSFCYLIDHLLGAFLGELHQTVFDYVVNEEVNVARDALLVRELLHCLLHQITLRVHKVSNVLYRLWIQLCYLQNLLNWGRPLVPHRLSMSHFGQFLYF